MASTASTEASNLKRRGRQRLIGAVALVALLVVFVPMLLDSTPRPAREGPSLAIPPKDPATPLSVAPAPEKGTRGQAPAAAQSVVTPAPDKSIPGQAPAAAKSDTATAAVVKAEAPAKAAVPPPAVAPAVTATAEPPRSGFAVQVGAFRDEEKLRQAREKLTAAKVSHYIERLDASGGGLTRLRAGPFKTREAAESALAGIRRASLDGKVISLP